MATQSSLQDTQELSPSHYEDFINAYKSENAQDLEEDREPLGYGDDILHQIIHAGDSAHIDLGLSAIGQDEERKHGSEPDVTSEPIEFSPTQASQHLLPQFPESQRFKTPGTNGKKRKFIWESSESPAPPRNPLAQNGVARTPVHALGLSQAFAATQAPSSPLATRHNSEPTSDRPSPNIELQARSGAASSSPLRLFSEPKTIARAPQPRYTSLQQSQVEREKQAALRKSSSELADGDDQSDDDFYCEPSIVKRKRREKEREHNLRERFQGFSSPGTLRSAHAKSGQPAGTIRIESPSLADGHGHQLRSKLPAVEDVTSPREQLEGDSEEETDVEDENCVVIRQSSQLTDALGEADKENVDTRALQIPETVTRPIQVNDGREARDTSPTLRRSFAKPDLDLHRNSPAGGQRSIHGQEIDRSPVVAIANSQPDQPPSKNPVLQMEQPTMNARVNLQNSPSVDEVTRIEQLPFENERSRYSNHTQPLIAESKVARGQQTVAGNDDRGHGLKSHEESVTPLPPRTSIFSTRFEAMRGEISSTVPETIIMRKSSSDVMDLSSDTLSKANNMRTEQQSRSCDGTPIHFTIDNQSPALDAMLSSPSGTKRKSIGDIAAQPSPPNMSSEMEMDEVIAEIDTSGFYNVVDNTDWRSGPKVPGSNLKVPLLPAIRTSSSCGTSASPEDSLRPSRPTSDVVTGGQVITQTRRLPNSGPEKSSCRSETIWEVQTSPSKSISKGLPKHTARGLTGSLRKRSLRASSMPSEQRQDSTSRKIPDDDHHSDPSSEIAEPKPQPNPDSTEQVAPNQVLAFFNGCPRGYYPTKCVGFIGSRSNGSLRYKIQWDKSSVDYIDEHGIRRLDLRAGDQVKVHLQGWPRVPYVVEGFDDRVNSPNGDVTDVRGYKTILLTSKKSKGLHSDKSRGNHRAPVSAIYLDTKLWGQMKERRLYESDHDHQKAFLSVEMPRVAAPGSGPRTPCEQVSTAINPRSRKRGKSVLPGLLSKSGVFSSMIFAISYPDESRKSSLGKMVTDRGATLLEDGFQEMFDEQSTHSHHAQQVAVLEKLTLSTCYQTYGFVALIADTHSRRPKYMEALALNIPCLSGKWIEACIAAESIVDWQPFLLAAGESLELEGAIRSRVLAPFDPRTAFLNDTVSMRPNFLKNEAFIVVAAVDSKGKTKQKLWSFLTRAAGARKVVECPTLKDAGALLDGDTSENFGWVFVQGKNPKSKTDLLSWARARRSKEPLVVGSEFLYQSLILGRLSQRSR